MQKILKKCCCAISLRPWQISLEPIAVHPGQVCVVPKLIVLWRLCKGFGSSVVSPDMFFKKVHSWIRSGSFSHLTVNDGQIWKISNEHCGYVLQSWQPFVAFASKAFESANNQSSRAALEVMENESVVQENATKMNAVFWKWAFVHFAEIGAHCVFSEKFHALLRCHYSILKTFLP